MTDKTFSRRLQQLISQLENHPHREEILKLASEQLVDDSTVVRQTTY
jgi:hypothetical protein